MITVSSSAVDALEEVLDANSGGGEDTVLRLSPQSDGQFGLKIDQPHEDDQVVTKGERPVLAVDREVARALDGANLDVTHTPEGPRLSLGKGD